MTEITYNRVVPSDIDVVMHIEKLDFSENEALSVASMVERIELISDSFIAARNTDGRVVGYITGPVTESRYLSDECFEHSEPNPNSGGFQKVISLAIDPEYQGLGIATKLLILLEEEARTKHRAGISLTCHDYLIDYYEKHGFKNEGLSESKFGGDTWYNMVMEF
ncbi:GNAT family N-acetyltransferase [Lactococcus protaetiae]|uniref:GNAT family N-acetyltransferase n=1 Tax=Lactococcus protaetiae TaxID=2592653 RepID=A0A514Z5W6_9LACT|nr:GNAT family N-acetyltransferase [Lactococcus protaetiae]QDK69994.1 GNAT family N-acetyltransferase [Lactococcus protaetiae]